MQKQRSLGERWGKFRPTKATLVWACLASIALALLLGFTWGGWMTASGAQNMAEKMASQAVVERLAPICVAQFNMDPDKAAKLGEMGAMSSSQTVKYVQEQGWATITGVERPDRRVADACIKLLMAATP